MIPPPMMPTKEEIEAQVNEILKTIEDTSLMDFIGKFLKNNANNVESLVNQIKDCENQIRILQAEKMKLFEIYQRVSE